MMTHFMDIETALKKEKKGVEENSTDLCYFELRFMNGDWGH